jgi:AMP-binding enzyme
MSTAAGGTTGPRAPTVTQALDHVLATDPERTALVGPSGSLSCAEFDDAANAAVVVTDPDTAATLEPRWRVVGLDSADPDCEWTAALAASRHAHRPATPDPEAAAAIAFTSGTTGLPKGVVHSQRNLPVQAASLAASRKYDATLRKGDCLPLRILNLQVLTTLPTAAAGGCCILTDRGDARGVAEIVIVDAFARNAMGKVERQALSALFNPPCQPLR